MKLIIAGGRDLASSRVVEVLNKVFFGFYVNEVISGGCSGVDRGGEIWAERKGIPVKTFKAQWTMHGRRAGPIRNRVMADYADAVVLFPGGKGTASMKREAVRADLIIIEANL